MHQVEVAEHGQTSSGRPPGHATVNGGTDGGLEFFSKLVNPKNRANTSLARFENKNILFYFEKTL
jgi:hypothetical protein